MKGLGRAWRETGQSRVPEPPQRMTGMIMRGIPASDSYARSARPSRSRPGANPLRPSCDKAFPGALTTSNPTHVPLSPHLRFPRVSASPEAFSATPLSHLRFSRISASPEAISATPLSHLRVSGSVFCIASFAPPRLRSAPPPASLRLLVRTPGRSFGYLRLCLDALSSPYWTTCSESTNAVTSRSLLLCPSCMPLLHYVFEKHASVTYKCREPNPWAAADI